MRKRFYLILLLALMLTACGEEPVIEVQEPPPLHNITDVFVWDSLVLESITPCNSYEAFGDDLQIFPYYNDTKYITIRKIVLSDTGFWETVSAPYKGTENFLSSDKYSLFTMTNGTTIGYFPMSDDYAYVVITDSLPSSYVVAVLNLLCN